MPLKEGQREGVRVASSLVAFLPRGRRGVLRVPVIGPLSCCYVRSGWGGVGVGGVGGGVARDYLAAPAFVGPSLP